MEKDTETTEPTATDENLAGTNQDQYHQQPRQKRSKDDTTAPASEKNNEDEDDDDSEDLKEKIVTAWKEAQTEIDIEAAFAKTVTILTHGVEALIRQGLEAFHRADNANAELKVLQDEVERKTSEMERLRVSEEKNSVALSNVLRALEQSRMQARDSSRAIVAEAGLRAELSAVVASRDEALCKAEASQRKADLLYEELRDQKNKLARVTQEKMKMEREHRASLSLAKSLDSHASSDAEYYKRKNAELNGHIQGLNAVVAEKNRQLDEMRRQIERNMSQNRLANLRREQQQAGRSGKRTL